MAKKPKQTLQDLEPSAFETEQEKGMLDAILVGTEKAIVNAGMVMAEVRRDLDERNQKMIVARSVIASWAILAEHSKPFQELLHEAEQLKHDFENKPRGAGLTVLAVQRHEGIIVRQAEVKAAIAEVRNDAAQAVSDFLAETEGYSVDWEEALAYSRLVCKPKSSKATQSHKED